jgi:hypothetical protein
MRHTVLPALVLALLVAVTVHGDGPPHVRIVDRDLHLLLQAGLAGSPTLRALVARLERSDVVAYVRVEAMRDGLAGRRQFINASAGARYVLIRVVRLPRRSRQLALLAHELHHAVEVASAPHVVDVQTLTQEYERIGQASRHRGDGARSFETAGAIAAGDQVLKELNRRDPGARRRPHTGVAALARAPSVEVDD